MKTEFEEFQEIAGRWCSNNYAGENMQFSLGSKLLKPEIDIRDYNISQSKKKSEINRLHDIRKKHLASAPNKTQPIGKILRYYPDRSLGDGLVFSESAGFISEDECPPWDTWFYFETEPNENENILYCWIPIQIVNFLTTAIKADQYNCLVWHE